MAAMTTMQADCTLNQKKAAANDTPLDAESALGAEKTLQVMKEADEGRNLSREFASVDELMADLNA